MVISSPASMFWVAKIEMVSPRVVGIFEFGIHEWLKREWRGNKPWAEGMVGSGVGMQKEFSAKASFKLVKTIDPLSRRSRNSSFWLGGNSWNAILTCSSVMSVWGLGIINSGFSRRIRDPRVMPLVAKTPHPLPIDGRSSNGAFLGSLRRRYACKEVC